MITARKSHLATIAGLAATATALPALAPAAESPPNIIIILADDMGWNQVRYQGSRWYETPNIDRIAREGTAYHCAYAAAPICSPSRAALMTGKYPARLHLTDYIPGNTFDENPLVTPKMQQGLPLAEVTLPERLHTRGYINGLFGKWHLADSYDYKPGRPMDPESQGFDVVYHTRKPTDKSVLKPDAHNAIAITDNALTFIRENKNRPFFCYIAHNVVHMPLGEEKELVSKYSNKSGAADPRNHPVMGAMIERMDQQIGRVLDELEKLDLTRRTIVIFASDNGDVRAIQSQAPFRGGKATLYQGGIRVPTCIRWPGVVRAGVTIGDDQPIITQDLFYTVTEAAGCETSDLNFKPDADGISLLNQLRTGAKLPARSLYWHYPHYHSLSGFSPSSVIRDGKYMMIQWAEGELLGVGPTTSLYDLSNDEGQDDDIAAQNTELVMRLRAKLNAWKKSVNAQEMTVRPNFDPGKAAASKKKKPNAEE